MKVIDNKGKLFSKINIIDLLVILFLLLLTPMFYFGYKVFTREPEQVVAPPKQFIDTEINVRFIKLNLETAKIISVGDKELSGNGKVIGEIVSLGEIEPYVYEFDIGQGQKIIKEAPFLKQIVAQIKVKSEVKGGSLYYKDKPIAINLPLEFKTDNYTITAVPFMEKKEEEKKEKVITDLYVILKNLDGDTLKKISVGDKELNKNNEVIAEILSLAKIENSSQEFNVGSGNFIRGEMNGKKQVYAKMRIKCEVGDKNQIYFKGMKLQHNKPFEFNTEKYTVNVIITDLFKEPSSTINEKWISLKVKFTGVASEIANVIQKEDTEKDVHGNISAKIRAIISNRESEVLILKEDKFITLNHPFNKDILVLLDVKCAEKDGIYYFNNYPVKMGNNITFTTDLYSITGMITGLEIK